jgi:hypothetical protein
MMAERKPFLLRIDPQVLKSLQKWADDDLRSLNGQIEYLLRRLLVEHGRLKQSSGKGPGAKGQGRDENGS